MQDRVIASIELAPSGQLFVCPNSRDSYELIYREANGLRWDRAKRALCAAEPTRWRPEVLSRHMAVTLRDVCDEALRVVPDTVWTGVSPELRLQLTAVLEGEA